MALIKRASLFCDRRQFGLINFLAFKPSAMTMDLVTNPVLINVTRSGLVESVHRGAVCVVDSEGDLVMATGDVSLPILPRSAIKPLQAIPFIETGAADIWKCSAEEIALACASHNADDVHLHTALGWINRLNLPEEALACGPQVPMGHMARERITASGETPTRLHNNCSGKHLGMVSTTLHMREPLEGYHRPDHPTQRRIQKTLCEMMDVDLTVAPMAVDGCTAPCWGISLEALARGFARFADPRGLSISRQSAIRRLKNAIAMHRELVAGADRFDTALITRKNYELVIKGGAEGVYAAALPSFGLGVALKIDDGARRAAEVAIAAILRYLEVLDDADWAALRSHVDPPIRNTVGDIVGQFEVAPNWLGGA